MRLASPVQRRLAASWASQATAPTVRRCLPAVPPPRNPAVGARCRAGRPGTSRPRARATTRRPTTSRSHCPPRRARVPHAWRRVPPLHGSLAASARPRRWPFVRCSRWSGTVDIRSACATSPSASQRGGAAAAQATRAPAGAPRKPSTACASVVVRPLPGAQRRARSHWVVALAARRSSPACPGCRGRR